MNIKSVFLFCSSILLVSKQNHGFRVVENFESQHLADEGLLEEGPAYEFPAEFYEDLSLKLGELQDEPEEEEAVEEPLEEDPIEEVEELVEESLMTQALGDPVLNFKIESEIKELLGDKVPPIAPADKNDLVEDKIPPIAPADKNSAQDSAKDEIPPIAPADKNSAKDEVPPIAPADKKLPALSANDPAAVNEISPADVAAPAAYIIKSVELTAADRKVILDYHNKVRKEVSPGASNMLKMVYDQGLEDLAKGYSRYCRFEHNPNRRAEGFENVGENLYIKWGITDIQKVLMDGAVSWYDEVKDYNYYSNGCSGVCGHYTQMVWAKSYAVGCGITDCGNINMWGQTWEKVQLMVCNYGPAGNWYGEKPYEAGASCSKCTGKCKKLDGHKCLC